MPGRRYSQIWRYEPTGAYYLVAPDPDGWAVRAWGPARDEQEARYLAGRKTLDGSRDLADWLNNRVRRCRRLV